MLAPKGTAVRSEDVARLGRMVRATSWLVELLRLVRDTGPPDAYVAAGVIRDLVWNRLTDRPAVRGRGDVDVVYFTPDEAEDRAAFFQAALEDVAPDVDWEVVNQAQVHAWHARQGRPVEPFSSLEESLRSWPETATAVAVRMADDETLRVVAPFGLADLFSLTLRANAGCPDERSHAVRVHEKRWLERWPSLRVAP